ncbi:hypothetical protein CSKR_202598 [Clonorchis sinensis]|uniref:Uncharacterized protein n=1 Tax=Clonorchis sinensis TaxID=79923 RepID=A0A8T1M1A9_CLOSI|nr:hypothetical protein CSKR_202598 [Clonorchis sinensis]
MAENMRVLGVLDHPVCASQDIRGLLHLSKTAIVCLERSGSVDKASLSVGCQYQEAFTLVAIR